MTSTSEVNKIVVAGLDEFCGTAGRNAFREHLFDVFRGGSRSVINPQMQFNTMSGHRVTLCLFRDLKPNQEPSYHFFGPMNLHYAGGGFEDRNKLVVKAEGQYVVQAALLHFIENDAIMQLTLRVPTQDPTRVVRFTPSGAESFDELRFHKDPKRRGFLAISTSNLLPVNADKARAELMR